MTSDLYNRIRFRGNPVAHPDAIITCGNARFTILTPRLIRLEWSETGTFEDRCTYAFPTRYTDNPPAFKVHTDGSLTIKTSALSLRFTPQGPSHSIHKFSANNLSITFTLNGETVVWKPGTPNPQNLRGTRRTLDECDGDAALDEGLLSRAGWTLFDDSKNVIFDETGWVGPRPDWEVQDWYFFAYGHDYKAALADYVQFGGEAPLIPRYILGGWWSRYWAYSEQDFRDLVAEFEAHNVPLDVFVIDMDWHTPDGWTGYTWNRDLFPDPPAFLQWLHDKGLRVTLNLHPADGVHPHEEVYPQIAQALGIDPASGDPVRFQIADKDYVQHYFEMIHHPMEDAAAGDGGVDFWWMDWQQGEISEVKGLDPLPWINHLHFNDIKRKGVRPMLYSRWGGLGNQRYYIGFSGDTYISWASLQFQPHLTATASNVAYGWWSHDIGGHMGGPTPPELYARWVQYGALSPILRLHATKDPRIERRPWAYPEPYAQAAIAAFHWRYRLIPYLYTMARVASDTSIPLCRPMYYEHPEADAAYVARYQYYFGNQMIAAPFMFPADEQTGIAHSDVWIPEGTWYAYDTQDVYKGSRWIQLEGDIHRMPMLMKSGAILPLAAEFASPEGDALTSGTADAQAKDHLDIVIFPGAGDFRLYEDDGVTEAYREGQSEWTPISTRQLDAHTWAVTIVPVEGDCDALPVERSYNVILRHCAQPTQVLVDDEDLADWEYNRETRTLAVPIAKRAKTHGVNLKVIATTTPIIVTDAAPAPTAKPFASFIDYTIPYEAEKQMGHVIIGTPSDKSSYDATITFTHFRAAETETHTITLSQTTGSSYLSPAKTRGHIIPTPFAFDGRVISQHWKAEVTFTWRGETWTEKHTSQPYFVTIPVVKAVIYNPETQPLALADIINTQGDTQGDLNPNLDWDTYAQQPSTMRNLAERHIVRFNRHDYAERLQAEEPLAAYIAITVTSPDARDAVLLFGAPEVVAFILNGQPVAIAEREDDPDVPAYFRPPRQTEPMRLRAGVNTLVVHSVAPGTNAYHWFFAGGFASLESKVMTDLRFT